jgi:hypothetical protein
MSREAVLGRRLIASTGHFSVSSVLQGQMLSSKQITRSAPLLERQDRPTNSLFAASFRAVYWADERSVHAQKLQACKSFAITLWKCF